MVRSVRRCARVTNLVVMERATQGDGTREPLRVGFDIGGLISKYPDIFRPYIAALVAGGVEVFVITDMPDHAAVVRLLDENGFGMIEPERVLVADYNAHGELCKAVLLKRHRISIFHDDHPGYLTEDVCPVRLLAMPDPRRAYYAPEWRTGDDAADFGRRVPAAGALDEAA